LVSVLYTHAQEHSREGDVQSRKMVNYRQHRP
jgi:hypothetical protein